MKKLTLFIALGLAFTSAPAFAHDDEDRYDDEHSHYAPARHDESRYEIDHLNRMYAHVRSHMGRYGTPWWARRELAHISGELSHVNWEYHTGRFGWYHLRGEVEHIHNELHNLELRLHFEPRYYYHWH